MWSQIALTVSIGGTHGLFVHQMMVQPCIQIKGGAGKFSVYSIKYAAVGSASCIHNIQDHISTSMVKQMLMLYAAEVGKKLNSFGPWGHIISGSPCTETVRVGCQLL
jgi:hypothetical protein